MMAKAVLLMTPLVLGLTWVPAHSENLPGDPRGFVTLDAAILGGTSQDNGWFAAGGGLGGGAMVPMGDRWTLVPRAQFDFCTGVSFANLAIGHVHWVRAGADARLGRHWAYAEAGLGMSVIDMPVLTGPFTSRREEQRWLGAPYMRIGVGLRAIPHADGSASTGSTPLLAELSGTAGLGPVRPLGFEFGIGTEF